MVLRSETMKVMLSYVSTTSKGVTIRARASNLDAVMLSVAWPGWVAVPGKMVPLTAGPEVTRVMMMVPRNSVGASGPKTRTSVLIDVLTFLVTVSAGVLMGRGGVNAVVMFGEPF